MNDPPAPVPLNYATRIPAKSSWPAVIYFAAMAWAMVTMYAYVAMTETYKADQVIQWLAQFAVLICAGLRFAWARSRREQGRGWIPYVAILALAPFLWAGLVIFVRMVR